MDTEQQERLRAAIGRNAERYLKAFERIEAKGGWAPGWNTAAFLHSTGWFCYRRMFGWAVLNFFALFVLMAILAFVGNALAPRANLDTAFLILAGAYLFAVFVLLPVFADSLYYRRLTRRLADPQAAPRPPSAWTGLGAVAFGTVWAAVVAVAMLPASGYQTRRDKVSEAILVASAMRTDITEFHQKNGRLPNVEEAVRFRVEGAAMRTKWVESVIYEAQSKRIVVTLREVYPGKRFALRAVERDGRLDSWACGPIDLDKKYLPGSCRD